MAEQKCPSCDQPWQQKVAPVQGYAPGIPWSIHMEAYAAYSKKWRPQQALIEGGCRGGFATDELDEFVPGWRERVSEIHLLRAEVARLRAGGVRASHETQCECMDCALARGVRELEPLSDAAAIELAKKHGATWAGNTSHDGEVYMMRVCEIGALVRAAAGVQGSGK